MLFLKKNLVKIEIFNTIMHQKCNKTWTGDCFLEIFEEIKAQNLNLTTLKQILASFEAYLNQILKKILLLFLSFLLLLSQQKKFHCCHVATKFYTTKWTCLISAHCGMKLFLNNKYRFGYWHFPRICFRGCQSDFWFILLTYQ